MRPRRLLVVVLCAASACFDPCSALGTPCGDDEDCPGDLVCARGQHPDGAEIGPVCAPPFDGDAGFFDEPPPPDPVFVDAGAGGTPPSPAPDGGPGDGA